jgi:hypothetical protein
MKTHIIAFLVASEIATISVLTAAPAVAASWQITHQSDRDVDHILMAATANADTGPGQMELFCDTDNGFRVVFEPKKSVMAEGPGVVVFKIDGKSPVALNANAYGDDDTDAVVVLDTIKVESALTTAKHVAVHFHGIDSSGDSSFTFDDLASQRDVVLKLCPPGR